jgi:hypothetical protein
MKLVFSVLTCCIPFFFNAQTYWQQEVNYNIQVKLNDKDHTLSAFEEFEYINHSPNTLNEIYIHLWPNAYRNGETALSKQLYEDGNNSLKYAKELDRGWIDSLDFKVDGQAVKWEYDTKHIDICKITLNSPLVSGASIKVSTPFKVKIPNAKFSRLGHVGQAYQITQWYPKPAVYDKNGWNQMPYLNQGEFYSEYGSFDVSITVPKNYVVGATGDLQTSSEFDFLNRKVNETTKYLAQLPEKDTSSFKRKIYTKINSSKDSLSTLREPIEYKTLRYIQSKVHDFAWFADQDFYVLKGEVELPNSKRKVTTWAMFTAQNAKYWKKSLEYLHDGTYYYSLWNGDYPYNQVTAVDGTISAGGGMEYPNVTVIGNVGSAIDLEVVIVHEVGHNWFYGILGSNERVHGWMDEGLNTLNEMRYVQTKYPNNKQMSDMVLGGRFHLNDLNHHDMGDISYRTIAMLGLDQPMETHSADFTSMNYGVIMYQKTGLVFHYLKAILGETLFDKSMQNYFETWKFKHPQPEDLKNALETASGKDLSWLFKDIVPTTKHLDFKIKSVKIAKGGALITLKNKGKLTVPAVLTVYSGDQKELIVTNPFKNKVTIPSRFDVVTKVIIDEDKQIPEMYRFNNTWDKKRFLHKREKNKLEFFIGDHEREFNNHFWSPAIGVNTSDKLMLGLTFHNMGIPLKKFQYFVAPMYSIGRNNLAGIGEINLTLLPANWLKVSRFGISIKSFSTEENPRNGDSYFVGIAPYWYGKLNTKNKNINHNLLLQTIYRYDQNMNSIHFYTPPNLFVSKSDQFTDHIGAFAQYSLIYNKKDYNLGLVSRLEYFDNLNNNDQILRASLELNGSLKYLKNKMNRSIEVRTFIGNIFNYSNLNYNGSNLNYRYSLSGAAGNQDLFLEEYFFNRSTGLSGYSAQRMDNMGGFRSTSNYGNTNGFMSTFNMYVQLPIKPNLFGLYYDAGIFSSGTSLISAQNFGLGLRLSKILGIYFPIWMSQNIESSYGIGYSSKIRFTVKLNIVNKPFNLSSLL